MPDSRQQIDEQAAEWMIRLHEGPLNEAERQAFERWKQQGPQHAASARRMEEVIARMQALRGQKAPARAALGAAFAPTKKPTRHKSYVRALALACCLALPAATLLSSPYPARWLADVRSGPAQWKTVHLPDDSTVTFNGTSAANLHFDSHERRVELLQGEILLDVAHDGARPFLVQTEQGTLRALGTRFVVKREGEVTVLTMLQSRVAAQSANGQQTVEVDAGSRALITTDAVRLTGTVDPASISDAWRRHQLVVDNRPLPEVLDEIARHRSGYLQFDREALAKLNVSVVLPLDDSDHALQLLAQTLPINLRAVTPWLMLVRPNASTEK